MNEWVIHTVNQKNVSHVWKLLFNTVMEKFDKILTFWTVSCLKEQKVNLFAKWLNMIMLIKVNIKTNQ